MLELDCARIRVQERRNGTKALIIKLRLSQGRQSEYGGKKKGPPFYLVTSSFKSEYFLLG